MLQKITGVAYLTLVRLHVNPQHLLYIFHSKLPAVFQNSCYIFPESAANPTSWREREGEATRHHLPRAKSTRQLETSARLGLGKGLERMNALAPIRFRSGRYSFASPPAPSPRAARSPTTTHGTPETHPDMTSRPAANLVTVVEEEEQQGSAPLSYGGLNLPGPGPSGGLGAERFPPNDQAGGAGEFPPKPPLPPPPFADSGE